MTGTTTPSSLGSTNAADLVISKKKAVTTDHFATIFPFTVMVDRRNKQIQAAEYSDSAYLCFLVFLHEGRASPRAPRAGVEGWRAPREGSGLKWSLYLQSCFPIRSLVRCLCGETCLGAMCLGRCRELYNKYSPYGGHIWGYRGRSGWSGIPLDMPGFASIALLGRSR